MIYKYCRRCGKRLKGEKNRARGFGAVCFAKQRAEQGKSLVPRQLTLFAEVDQAEQRAEQRARASREEKGASREQGGQPPHLEKTLTPTYKMGLLFTPHSLTPTENGATTAEGGSASTDF